MRGGGWPVGRAAHARVATRHKEKAMSISLIVLILLILLLVGALPTWPHSRSWGYGPSGGLGLVVLIVLVLLLMGRI
jgi:asparagine N-glycosylation enzyme membrane subunit Stt3